jgi:hypothetical protein
MNGSERNETGVEYSNILADITIGKNFEEHYRTVTHRIEAFNRSIDNKKKSNEDCNWIVGICYNYYRLQELIRVGYKNKS